MFALAAESAQLFERADLPVLYCGVGKVNAAMTLSRALEGHALRAEALPLVVNFGSVGSRSFKTGTLVACHEFIQRDMDVTGLGFELGVTPYDEVPARLVFEPRFAHLPAAVCGSGDSFATSDIAMTCEVVDMEAYALAKVCWCMGAKFACAKFVTDGADAGAAADWQQNVHKAAQDFFLLFKNI